MVDSQVRRTWHRKSERLLGKKKQESLKYKIIQIVNYLLLLVQSFILAYEF